jgi:hypothetical protein
MSREDMHLKPLKPYMLRRWRIGGLDYFFTCARPGRTGNPVSKNSQVQDSLVRRWVLGLPGPNTAIVSLLGSKPDGRSEFSFYSFYGGFDLPAENPGRLSFQQWVDKWHGCLAIIVREHPTHDFQGISNDVLEAVASDIRELLSEGRIVVVVDSGGQTRTGMICSYMGAIEDSSQWPRHA